MRDNQHFLGEHILELFAQWRLTRLPRTVFVIQLRDIGAFAKHGLAHTMACLGRRRRMRGLAAELLGELDRLGRYPLPHPNRYRPPRRVIATETPTPVVGNPSMTASMTRICGNRSTVCPASISIRSSALTSYCPAVPVGIAITDPLVSLEVPRLARRIAPAWIHSEGAPIPTIFAGSLVTQIEYASQPRAYTW